MISDCDNTAELQLQITMRAWSSAAQSLTNPY